MKLVDNWRTWHKRWSVWLGTLGTAIVSLLVAWPDAAIKAWAILPAELRAAIPSKYMPLIGVAVFVVSMLAQLVQQKKLQKPGGDDAKP